MADSQDVVHARHGQDLRDDSTFGDDDFGVQVAVAEEHGDAVAGEVGDAREVDDEPTITAAVANARRNSATVVRSTWPATRTVTQSSSAVVVICCGIGVPLHSAAADGWEAMGLR